MPPSIETYDAVILGAGGAGLMCARAAAARGRRVLLIDHADQPGKKILISGGGRCNFTNTGTTAANYLSANRHFAKSALARYTPADFIALVDRHRIAWHEKTLGQLFCDGSAKQIVAMLLNECQKGDVTLKLGTPVNDIRHTNGRFEVTCGNARAQAPALVLATGGPSIPKMGATGFAYEIARQFGMKVVDPRPALVPLTLGGDEALFRSLSGVSADVRVSCGNTSFREAALFTHKGLSGPAILQISSYWKHGASVHVDFLPESDPAWADNAKRDRHRATLKTVLSEMLPARLVEALVERLANDVTLDRDLANTSNKTLAEVRERLARWEFKPNGTEGFAKAEVTIGGISTADISSQTMESKTCSGLYPVGEAVDVTGWLGGYNFQWAWASGWVAGQAI